MKQNTTPTHSVPLRQSFLLLRWELFFSAAILGLFMPQAPWPCAMALLLLLLFAFPLLRTDRGLPLVLGCCVLGALLAATLRIEAEDVPAPLPAWMEAGQKVFASGRILQVAGKPNQRLQILMTDVVCKTPRGESWRMPSNLVLTWIRPELRPLSGERLQSRLRIKPVHNFSNINGLDVKRYWAKQGVGYRAYLFKQKEKTELLPRKKYFLQKLRLRIMNLAIRTMGGETRMTQGKAVLFALLFGERYYISTTTAGLLNSGSLAHSLALSGLHVGFAVSLGALFGLFLCLLAPGVMLLVPRTKWCMLFGLSFAVPYVWLGNATPSLLRAFAMFAVWFVLLWRGSPRVLLDGLFIALLILLFYDPSMAYDLRLQLSACAVAGIACFAELRSTLKARLARSNRSGPQSASPPRLQLVRTILVRIGDLLGCSLAAQLATLPLVIACFGEVPLNPLPNLLWLPLLFAALPCGVFSLLLTASGAAYPGSLLMALTSALLDKGLLLLEQLQNWHLLPTLLCLRPGPTAWTGYWSLLLCAVLATRTLLQSKPEGAARSSAPRLRTIYLLSTALLFAPALAGLAHLNQDLRLTMLDVGQGQSLLLDTPAGKRLLIDGGGFASRTFDVGKAILAPVLTNNHAPTLDWVAYSHPDNDHIRGLLYVLSRFRVSNFATNGCLPRDWNQIPLALILQQRRLRPEIWSAGQIITLEPGLRLDVLHPPLGQGCSNSNNASLCLRLSWNNRGLALMPGDLEDAGLHTLLKSGRTLASQILILPHHGAKSACNRQFYARVAPVAALCSAGFLNQFHFPSPDVVNTLSAMDIPLYCTATWGSLEVSWKTPDAPPMISSRRRGALTDAAGSGQ